jgi:hypothetical protein
MLLICMKDLKSEYEKEVKEMKEEAEKRWKEQQKWLEINNQKK